MIPEDSNRPIGADNLPTSVQIAPVELATPPANTEQFDSWLDQHSASLSGDHSRIYNPDDPGKNGVRINVDRFVLAVIGAIFLLSVGSISAYAIYNAVKGPAKTNSTSGPPSVQSNILLSTSGQNLHINYDTTIAGGKNLSATGEVLIQDQSSQAFKIQDSDGSNIMVADTKDKKITIGDNPPGQVSLSVNGDISVNGQLVSTTQGYALSDKGLTIGGVLVCTANGCVSSSSPPPTPSSPSIDVANLMYLNTNQTISGAKTFGAATTFNSNVTVNAPLQVAGNVNSTAGFSVGGTAGGSFSCGPTELLQQAVISGGIITSGTCVTVAGGTTPTLQNVYDASAPARVVLSNASGVIDIQDASSPLATNLFQVGSNGDATLYFAVNNLGISVTGNVNTTGQYRVGGSQISSANLSNDSNLAKVNGNTTFTGNNTFSSASNSFTGNGSGLTALNASSVSSGTLNDARLSANVTAQGNTFNGASQLVQLTAGGILPVLNGSNLTALDASNISSGTLNDSRLSSNVALLSANNIFLGNDSFHLNSAALSVQDASSPLAGNLFQVTDNAGTTKYFEVSSAGAKVNGNAVCTATGNCVGTGGGGAIGGSGTAGKLAVFTGSGFTIGDSLLSQSGGTVTVSGNISLSTGNTYQINGSQISSANLSNDANLAKLNANQTFSGNNTFSSASNSFTGSGTGLTALNASNVSSGTLNDARLSSNVALKSASNTFTGNNVFSLNTAGLAVQDAASPLGTNLFEVTDNTGTTKYFTVSATALQFNGNDVCTASGNCVGTGGGGAIGGSGTAGKIAKFTGSGFTIGDSLISDNGSTVTVGGTLAVNTISPTAALTIGLASQTLTLQGDSGTSLSATAGGIKNNLVFAAPTVSNKTITIPNASGTVAVSASGPLALDAAGNLSCPTCLTSGGGNGVSSVNSLSGAITLAGTANQVTITPVSNTLTFSLPQNIATTSSPTFANINVSSGGQYQINGSQISSADLSNDSNLAKLNGTQSFTGANTFSNASNSFTGDGTGLTNVDAAKLNGQAGSYYTNASNISTGTLNDGRLSPNVALLDATQTFSGNNVFQTTADSATAFQIQDSTGSSNLLVADTTTNRIAINQASSSYTLGVNGTINGSAVYQNGNQVCDSSGNCVGVSGGAIGGSGTAGKIALFTGSGFTIGDSQLTQASGTVTNSGNETVTGSATFNGAVLAKNTSNSTAAFQVQDSSTAPVLNVDTTNSRVDVGNLGTTTSQLYVGGSVASAAVSTTSTNNNPYGIAVSGNYTYVINNSANTLQTFDTSNPAAPALMSTVSTSTHPLYIVIAGRYAYVDNGTGANNLQTFDLSNPASPVLASTVSGLPSTIPVTMVAQGHFLYMTYNGGAFGIYDLSNPAVPARAGSILTTNPNDLAVQGRYAYVTSRSNGGSATLQIFDVANPKYPVSVSKTNVGGTVTAQQTMVAVKGRYAYVFTNQGSASADMEIYDVSNPAAPSLTGSVSTGAAGASAVYRPIVSGQYVYASNFGSSTLQTFDVSNPAAPALIGTTNTGTNPSAMAIQGRYAYATNYGAAAFQIFDLGGTYSQTLQAGSTQTTSLTVGADASIGGNVSVQGGASVGGGLQVAGQVGISGSLNLSASTLAAPAAPTLTSSGTGGSLAAATYYYKLAAITGSVTTQAVASSPASVTTSGSVSSNTLSWSTVSGATGYAVYRSTDNATWFVNTLPGTATSLADNGSTYVWTTSGTPLAVTDGGGNLTVNGFGLFQNATNSTTAFQVQNAAGNSILSVDTSGNQVVLGKASSLNGTLVFNNNAGSNTVSIVAQASNPASSVTIQLPTVGASGAGQCVLSDTGSTTTNSLLKFSTCPSGSTSQTKVVAMGSPAGCSGSVPVASQDTNADYVVNSCTSAQTTINTAISAISSTGGTIYLKEGTYIVDGSINLAANVKLAGSGNGTVLKLKNSINADINLISGSSISNIGVENLILDGNRTNNSSGNQVGVSISSSGSGSGSSAVVGYTLSGVTAKNFLGTAFTLSGSNDIIKNVNLINNGGYGIGFTGTTNVLVSNSDISGNGNQGIDCFGIVNSTITGNMFQGNASEGGIKLATGTGNTISGNTFISNAGAGIKVLSTGNTITGNTFTGNSGDGVYVQASGNSISGNTATSNTSHGIDVFSSGVSVTGNRTTGNSSDGISIAGSSNQISGNTTSGNLAWGIEVTGSTNTINGNTSTSNGNDGIKLDGLGSNQNIISGNQINSNGGNGVMVDASSQNQITDNRIHNNGGGGASDGIQISAGCCTTPDKNTVTDNVITDTAGTGYAIEITGSPVPTNTYVANNTYSGTGASSIHDTSTSTTYANQLTSTGGLQNKVGTNSSAAFQVQSASGASFLTVDTTSNDLIQIGSSTTDATAVLQVLDSYNNASDPTGVNGAMYYNTSLNAFRCFQNSVWVNCAGSGAGTLSASYNAGSTSADQTLNLSNAKGGGVILKDNSTPITGSLFSVQNNGGSAFLDVSSSKITVGENTVGNATATATTATTSGTGTNTTTVTLTAVNSLANGDVIFIDNAGQDYFTRITAGGGTTSLTVDPAVTYENARTVTKYNVQYLGSDGTNFTGSTRNQNSFYQGYFLGGVVTGAGSTVYSDANIQSINNLQINTATGVNVKGTNSTTAFQVQNSSGVNLLNIDSTNMQISFSQSGLSLSDLSAPSSPGVAAGATTGGTLSGAAGTTYYYKITAMSGTGESLGSSEVSINGQGFTKLSAPGAPNAAVGAAGNVTGSYTYKVTFITANGETTAGTASSVVSPSAQQVSLTAIPTGPTGTTGRNVYRCDNAGANCLRMTAGTTLANNTTTILTDNTASYTGNPANPGTNTATTNTNNATVTWTAVGGATGYRVYRGTAAGAESVYFTSTSSPFTDTGAAGTAGTVHTYSTIDAVGIGTSTPAANLDVEGTGLFKNAANSTSAFQVQDSSGVSVLNVDTTNRVIGINNTAATATLDVSASAVSYFEGFESGSTGNFSGALWTASTTNPHTGAYSIGATTGGVGTLTVTKTMNTAGTVSFWSNIQSGCCATPSTFKIDGVTQQSWSPNTTTPWTFYSYSVTSGSHTYTWAFNNTQPAYWYIDDFKLTMNTGSAYAAAFNNGNVGIGTSTPGSTLEVDGTATFKLPTTTNAFQIQNGTGTQILTVDPITNSATIAQGNLTVSGLSNITSTPTLTSSSTGGSLAAGTYYYEVSASNANGTTAAVATNPTSVTTSGSTSQNTVTWAALTNASGYKVYRSTNGTTWFVNSVSAGVTTLVDNGSTYTWSSAIAPPTTNTTGGNLTVKGAVTFTNASNSTSALDVQDATGDSILRVDSTDRHVGINNSAPVAALDVVASPPAPDFTWGFEDGTYGALSHSGGNKISPAGAHTGSYGWWGDTCGNPSDTMTLTRSLGSAGYISFWAQLHGFWGGWNVFWIDGVAKIALPGGTIPYTLYTYPLSAGTHTFQWNTGDTCDYIYVDDITVGTNAPNSNAAVFNGGNVGIGTVAPSATLETDGTSIFKATTNVTSTLQVQNATGDSLLNADTTNSQITIGRFVDGSLSAPASPGAAAGSNTGGTLSGAAGTTYYYKVSAMTVDGETPLSSEVSINGQSFTKLSAPGAATVGTPSVGGSVTTGTHSYKVTFVTANGETTGGTVSSQVNVTTGGTQTVPLTAIPTGPTGTTQRKVYRTVSGDTGNYLLVTTIADNSTTTFNDTVADGSLGAAAPASNTATTNTNNATISWSAVTGATSYRVYRGTASGAENAYQTTSASPFTDTGVAGTSLTNSSLAIKGTTSAQNVVDSTTAFQIQNASGASLFTVDTTNSKITLGAPSANPVLLVLGTKNTSGDPTCSDGAIYYNSNTKRFRACTNGTWATFGAFAPGYELSYDQITSNASLSSTTEAGANTAITSTSVTYDGSTVALVEVYVPNMNTANTIGLGLWLDGTEQFGHLWAANATGDTGQVAFRTRVTLSAGSHTITVRGWDTGGTGTLNAGSGIAGANSYPPAYIRVTVAQ